MRAAFTSSEGDFGRDGFGAVFDGTSYNLISPSPPYFSKPLYHTRHRHRHLRRYSIQPSPNPNNLAMMNAISKALQRPNAIRQSITKSFALDGDGGGDGSVCASTVHYASCVEMVERPSHSSRAAALATFAINWQLVDDGGGVAGMMVKMVMVMVMAIGDGDGDGLCAINWQLVDDGGGDDGDDGDGDGDGDWCDFDRYEHELIDIVITNVRCAVMMQDHCDHERI